MTDNDHFAIEVATINAASSCEKGQICLTKGPQCRASRQIPGAPALIVHCKEIGPCTFKTGYYREDGEETTICSCPVRLEFFRRHGI